MGNCRSDEYLSAINKDGLQNVRKVAIIKDNQRFVDQYAEDMKTRIQDQIRKRDNAREENVGQRKQELLQKFNLKKAQLEAKSKGAVEKLQKTYNQSFSQLTGYDAAIQKLSQLSSTSKSHSSAQSSRLFSQLSSYQTSLKSNLQSQKPTLPTLNTLSQQKLASILSQVTSQNKESITMSNVEIQKQLDSKFNTKEILTKRLKEEDYGKEMDGVREQFQELLVSSTKKGKFGCF